jgi:hypothetical protein
MIRSTRTSCRDFFVGAMMLAVGVPLILVGGYGLYVGIIIAIGGTCCVLLPLDDTEEMSVGELIIAALTAPVLIALVLILVWLLNQL